MSILWIILIGFVAGMIARYLVPGPNNPSGFILTVVLGIAGSFLATFLAAFAEWVDRFTRREAHAGWLDVD